MSAMNKANGRQNSKRKFRYQPYKDRGLREINKALKLMRHLREQPEDKAAEKALAAISEVSRKNAVSRYESARNRSA